MQMVSKSIFYTYYRMENEQRTKKITLLIALMASEDIQDELEPDQTIDIQSKLGREWKGN